MGLAGNATATRITDTPPKVTTFGGRYTVQQTRKGTHSRRTHSQPNRKANAHQRQAFADDNLMDFAIDSPGAQLSDFLINRRTPSTATRSGPTVTIPRTAP